MRCLRIQLISDLRRVQSLLLPTLLTSVLFSYLLKSPFVLEPVFTYVGILLTLLVVELHGSLHATRIFSCDGIYGRMRVLSSVLLTLGSATFAVFTMSGFLNIAGIAVSPAEMLSLVLFTISFTSIAILGTFYVSAFSPTLLLAIFAVAELSFVISGGREALLMIVTDSFLSQPPAALLLSAISLSVIWKETPSMRYGAIGDFSRIIRVLPLPSLLLSSAVRYYFITIPLIFMPAIYTLYSDEGVRFAYLISAAFASFLTINLSVKNIDAVRLAGVEKLLASSALLVTLLLLLNTPLTGISGDMVLTVLAASLLASVGGISAKLRRNGRVFLLFSILSVALLGVVYHSPLYSLPLAALLALALARRC